MGQADYELRLEREHQRAIDLADTEYEIELTLGDAKVSVFYTVDNCGHPTVTCAHFGAGQADADCFSKWQLADWTASITKHLRAEREQAEADMREVA